MRLTGLPYPVVVTRDAARATASLCGRERRSVAIIYDRRLEARAKEIAAALRRAAIRLIGTCALSAGERAKRWESVSVLHRWLIGQGADRRCLLLAIGGGTLTDLTGFAAAIFLRGVAWAAVPTTLVGMVDAAIGGKTAIDLPEGKNLVGAFWDPIGVVCDLPSLESLPIAQRRNGVAEIVKTAVVADAGLLDALDAIALGDPAARWERIIARTASIKIRIVAQDPRDDGRRAELNLGHTLGHAFELASGFRLPHGVAVSVGLRGAGLLALGRGLWSTRDHARMLRSLARAGLPLHLASLDAKSVVDAAARDKKRLDGKACFVLPVRLGEVRTGQRVEAAELHCVVKRCLSKPSEREWTG
ncbi:MAG: 3-dehydroquinate synthase [Candidatus Eremiobacteraeota bacterium]|nr:3-dehydroquinate synthase [Candidatus Eremiobacteraeota bacterium]